MKPPHLGIPKCRFYDRKTLIPHFAGNWSAVLTGAIQRDSTLRPVHPLRQRCSDQMLIFTGQKVLLSFRCVSRHTPGAPGGRPRGSSVAGGFSRSPNGEDVGCVEGGVCQGAGQQ